MLDLKALSYSGRLQLAVAVLYSIQAYWANIFILPKAVLKGVDRSFEEVHMVWFRTQEDRCQSSLEGCMFP